MKIRLKKWALAYRKKDNCILFQNDSCFYPLKQSFRGCYADPFLFDYHGETYLFAEYLDYRSYRGTIAYSKYNKEKESFEDFQEIIKEDFHLSYPLVFEYNSNIFMMPEANNSNSLYIYKAIQFPNKWVKAAVLIDDIKLVDTTLFSYKNNLYAITKRNETPQAPMLLLRIDPQRWRVIDSRIITDDISVSRPGGNVFCLNDQYYMVTQDCQKDYGFALNILSFFIDDNMTMKYDCEKRITPKDVRVSGYKNIKGIHTYNFCEQLEVIDFKYPKLELYRSFWRLIHRFMGLN